MPSEWYYTVNGQQAPAPATASQLKQMAATGQLQPTDLVWQEGMANWAPASSIKGLFGARSGAEQPALVEPPASRGKPRGKSRSRGREESDEEETGGGLAGLHPILVWLLSTCTLGLFGLIYAYAVCSAYAEQGTREADSSGRALGRVRHPLAVLLLSYLTLGIYFYYWAYCVLAECKAFTGRADLNPRTEVGLMLAFPPYAVYVVVFRLPELIRAAQQAAKLPESAAVNHAYVFIIPCLLPGLPVLGMAEQDALNQVWFQAP